MMNISAIGPKEFNSLGPIVDISVMSLYSLGPIADIYVMKLSASYVQQTRNQYATLYKQYRNRMTRICIACKTLALVKLTQTLCYKEA